MIETMDRNRPRAIVFFAPSTARAENVSSKTARAMHVEPSLTGGSLELCFAENARNSHPNELFPENNPRSCYKECTGYEFNRH